MAVKIRLKRMGKKKQPTYRVVVADSRSPRDGRIIESIGRYDPRQDPSLIEIDGDRALYWLQTGAQPTERAKKLLEINGTWAKFRVAKGEVYTIPAAAPVEAEESVPDAQEAKTDAAEPSIETEPAQTTDVAEAQAEPAEEAEPAQTTDVAEAQAEPAEEAEPAPDDSNAAGEETSAAAETDAKSDTEDAK